MTTSQIENGASMMVTTAVALIGAVMAVLFLPLLVSVAMCGFASICVMGTGGYVGHLVRAQTRQREIEQGCHVDPYITALTHEIASPKVTEIFDNGYHAHSDHFAPHCHEIPGPLAKIREHTHQVPVEAPRPPKVLAEAELAEAEPKHYVDGRAQQMAEAEEYYDRLADQMACHDAEIAQAFSVPPVNAEIVDAAKAHLTHLNCRHPVTSDTKTSRTTLPVKKRWQQPTPTGYNFDHRHGPAAYHCHSFKTMDHLKVNSWHSAQSYNDSPVVRKAVDAGYKTSRSGPAKDEPQTPPAPAAQPQRPRSAVPEPDWGDEPEELALCADLPTEDVRAMLSRAWAEITTPQAPPIATTRMRR